MNRMLFALTVVLLATSSARADMGPFLPAQAYAKVVHRIEITEEQPDYVFVVCQRFDGPPHFESRRESTFVYLKPGQPLEFTGERYDTAGLLIVPREVAKAFPSAAALAESVQSGETFATQHRFTMRSTVPAWGQSEITATYRVQPAKSGGLEIVRTSWDPLWQWYIVALLVPLAFLLGGIWIVRRFTRYLRAKLTA
jgi:hypothetical protein